MEANGAGFLLAAPVLTWSGAPIDEQDDVASTAVFACIVMMQKDRVFMPRVPAAPKKA